MSYSATAATIFFRKRNTLDTKLDTKIIKAVFLLSFKVKRSTV